MHLTFQINDADIMSLQVINQFTQSIHKINLHYGTDSLPNKQCWMHQEDQNTYWGLTKKHETTRVMHANIPKQQNCKIFQDNKRTTWHALSGEEEFVRYPLIKKCCRKKKAINHFDSWLNNVDCNISYKTTTLVHARMQECLRHSLAPLKRFLNISIRKKA